MDRNVKIAKELVRLAKSLVAANDSIFVVKRLNNGKEIHEWESGKTPISEAPYKIEKMSKADLSKYITIEDDKISISLPAHTFPEYAKLQSDKYDFNPYRMFWTTSESLAEAEINAACLYEVEYYKNKKTNDNESNDKSAQNHLGDGTTPS